MAKGTKVPGLGPTTPVGDVAESIISVRLAQVRRLEGSLKERGDPDAVHDLRVATRRLRAAIHLVGCDSRVDREVKRFQDALGSVRDLQVQLDWLRANLKGAGGQQLGTVSAVEREIAVELPARMVTLRRELQRWQTQTVPLVRAAMTKVTSTQPLGGSRFRGLIRKRLQQIRESMKCFAAAQDALTAHRLRIRVKKLRYVAELLEPVWPDKIGLVLATLHDAQEILGDLHDADVRVAQLAQLAGLHSSVEEGALTLLAQAEKDRDRREASAASLVLRWQTAKTLRDLKRLFSKRAVAAP
jgi:CHAD domain-containing protein